MGTGKEPPSPGLIRATAALALLLFRHWARASLPNRLRKDKGRRASAGLFRLGYLGMMSAWGYTVGHLVAKLDSAEQRTRGAAWILIGTLGLTVVWSALTRGPTLRAEPSPLETPFLETLPLRDSSRLVVGLLERLFVFALGGAALIGVFPGAPLRAAVAALILSTAGVFVGEAGMRVARVVFPPMLIARARTYMLVLGQVLFLMCVVQAPSLARAKRLGVLVAGLPSRVVTTIDEGDRFVFLVMAACAILAFSLGAIRVAERIGYDKIDLVPSGRPRRSKSEVLVIDRVDDVLRVREPGGRWSAWVMMGYTTIVTAGLLAFAWHSPVTLEQSGAILRGVCSLAAFGAFVVTTTRASRMAMRDVAARPLLAPLPIEPRTLLHGKVTRLRRDALLVALPITGLLFTPWSLALHLETAWRIGAVVIAVVTASRAAAAVAFLTVGAGNKKGPGGGFAVESVLVLVPLVGVATAPYAWSVLVPLAALGLVAREASRSALGCVRWIDDGDDFERETPIWRALLVLGAFHSAQMVANRIVALTELEPGMQTAIVYLVSSTVLVALTIHGRRDAPSMRLLPERGRFPALLLGAAGGLASGALAFGYLHALRWLGVALPVTSGTSKIAVALIALVLAPPAEELFFRGWLLPCIEDEVNLSGARAASHRRWLAPVLAAFAFAAVHPPLSFPAVFVLGLVASALFTRTRALGPAIAAHLVHNAVAVLLGQ